MRKIYFYIAALLSFVLLSCRESSLDSLVNEYSTDKFLDYLKKGDFTVQEGDFISVDMLAWCEKGIVLTSYYNNAGSPYKTFVLPPAPTQTVSNYRIFDPVRNLYLDYKLDKDEALVFIGKTPPKSAYFSFNRYLSFKYTAGMEKYKRIMAPLGDEINNLSVSTSTESDGNSGPFNEDIVIILTANKFVESRIIEMLKNSAFNSSMINSSPLPADISKFGLDVECDNFALIHRINVFENDAEKEQYMNSKTGRVFRITPKIGQPDDLYKWADLRKRGTGTNENYLKSALDSLQSAVIAKYSGYKYELLGIKQAFPDDPVDCINKNIDAYGFSNDAAYITTDGFTLKSENEFVVMLGVNNVETGKATYSNLSVYGKKLENGVTVVFNKDYYNSAFEYLPNNSNSKKLFVWKFTRSVPNEKYCSAIPYNSGIRGIDLNETIEIFFRTYLEKATMTGPAYNELLWGRAIKFYK